MIVELKDLEGLTRPQCDRLAYFVLDCVQTYASAQPGVSALTEFFSNETGTLMEGCSYGELDASTKRIPRHVMGTAANVMRAVDPGSPDFLHAYAVHMLADYVLCGEPDVLVEAVTALIESQDDEQMRTILTFSLKRQVSLLKRDAA